MSDTVYFVEYAKSGRAKCKRCQEPIGKGDVKVVSETNHHGDRLQVIQSFHPHCFVLPRRYAGLSTTDFCHTVLEDRSSTILSPGRVEDVIEALDRATRKRTSRDDGTDGSSWIDAYQAAYQARADGPPSKQAKVEPPTPSSSSHHPTTVAGELDRGVDLYATHHTQTIGAVKDILRWNRQVLTGTKPVLLRKVIDGALRGRLARCQLDGGRLKLDDRGAKVVCSGSFDEDSRMRMPCAFSCALADAPREPWFSSEPTQEESDEMDRLDEVAKELGGGGGGNGGDAVKEEGSADLEQLQLAAASLDDDWNLTSNGGKRAAAVAMAKLFTDHAGKTLDIPEGIDYKQKIGPVVVANPSSSAKDMIRVIIAHFGWKEDKAAKQDKKQKAVELAMACPANTPAVLAINELADLYFKEGNRNAGASYKKAVAALKDLTYEITKDNAKGLGKGKTKVACIGKGTADKLHEFVTTGQIEKLEEKRANQE